MPELTLVVRVRSRWSEGAVDGLYSGRIDPETIASRFEKALVRPGWRSPKREVGSPFPYSNFYLPWQDLPWWDRLPFSRLTARKFARHPYIDLRIFKGRAGAKPTGGDWTTVLVREELQGQQPGPNMSEPVPGWGVQVR